MQIKVRYFASLREQLGRSEQLVEVDSGTSLLELWTLANPDVELPRNTLVALNMEYVAVNELVNEGDEVAFFPPVTGG